MPLVNSRLALASYVMSAAGASGASLMVLSYAMPAPNDLWGGNVFTVHLTNAAPTAPLHVQMRTTWTDMNGTSQTTPVTLGFVSNTQTFGGSALYAQTLAFLVSGQGAVIPFGNVTGSAVQVWLLAASTTADAAGVSGAVQLWRAQ